MQLRGDLPRDVADLQRPLLVPDRNCIRIVLVVWFRDESQRPAWIERRIRQRLGPVGDTRSGDDTDPLVLPLHAFPGRRVSKVVARLATLEPEAKALDQQNTATWKSRGDSVVEPELLVAMSTALGPAAPG